MPKKENFDFRSESGVDKHKLYHEAVQAPKQEISTLLNFYHEINSSSTRKRAELINSSDDSEDFDGKVPTVFREDFCGTAVLCAEWSLRSPLREAYGVDIDANVIEYSMKHILSNPATEERVHLTVADVLKVDNAASGIPKCDILAALNYGIFYFKSRRQLVKYFKKCKESLALNGILVCDMFGGSQCYQRGKRTVRELPDFTYYFEQRHFDLMTNSAKCFLHFKLRNGGGWLKNAFVYDFRIYTIVEVREAMKEAGFSETFVWWTEAEKCPSANDQEEEEEEEEDNEEEGLYVYEQIEDGQRVEGVYAWNAYVIAIL